MQYRFTQTILHSLIEDRFEVKAEGSSIAYQLHLGNSTALEAFQEVFADQMKDIRAIRLIEATLFLSMIPLHNDYINRQYMMLATGVQLFQQVVKEG